MDIDPRISDPFASESEWLPHIGNLNYQSKKHRYQLLYRLVVPLAACALVVGISFALSLSRLHSIARLPSKAPAKVPAKASGDAVDSAVAQSTDESRLPSVQPEFLRGLLPKVVYDLQVQNLEGSKERKLIVWSRAWCQDNVWLIEVRKGHKARVLDRAGQPDGHYCPELKTMPNCKYRGHQIYLLFEQGGVAWQFVKPLYVDGSRIHIIQTIDQEVFQIQEFQDHSRRLVGYSREWMPYQFEKPTVYQWNGHEFQASTQRQRKFYEWMIKHKLNFGLEEFDIDEAELADAEVLAERGHKKLAREIILDIKDAIKNGESIDAMGRVVNLLDHLGLHRDALEVALREAKFSVKGIGDPAQMQQSERSVVALVDWLANNGHFKEAHSLETAFEEREKRESARK